VGRHETRDAGKTANCVTDYRVHLSILRKRSLGKSSVKHLFGRSAGRYVDFEHPQVPGGFAHPLRRIMSVV
jgi:hypothetical protein